MGELSGTDGWSRRILMGGYSRPIADLSIGVLQQMASESPAIAARNFVTHTAINFCFFASLHQEVDAASGSRCRGMYKESTSGQE